MAAGSTTGGVGDRARRMGRKADDSDRIDHVVRFGMVVYGVVHLVIAWLAIQIAFGDQKQNASSSGALHEIASQPFGAVAVWLVALGMLVLVAWRLLEAVTGHRDEDGAELARKRAVSVLKAVLYGAIGISALRVAVGEGSKGGTDSTTAKLMDLPAGQWIVGLVGLGIIGYGLNQVRIAWTEKFRKHLTAEGKRGGDGTAYVWFGKVGYAAKGVAVGVVGTLFLYAAVTHEAKKSGGLDQALQEIRQQAFGPYLLVAVGLGIGSYGLFCFARARHLDR
ncbi:DUF1206 domain-containing protein [Nocardioides donggukensis]|uniref:DUF1206 domain-containing protein n=1 Tax=Nocardioides donggukensis TaxID=2774019 RepID=A0A927K4S3_9ACTN|nr:DUF1206 domain-containing protein [Nocardioides donggukensis]MBD8869748.1 DUF1206 domain-containing protein [Nocardioides donggukensis]